jgi:hypothetical protein
MTRAAGKARPQILWRSSMGSLGKRVNFVGFLARRLLVVRAESGNRSRQLRCEDGVSVRDLVTLS